MEERRIARILTLVASAAMMSSVALAQDPDRTYWIYVGAESADLLHRVRFGPDGAVVERTTAVGEMQLETEGPHGLRMAPDGGYLYLTTGHGFPDGKLWKVDPGPDTLVGEPTLLGKFPATIDLTPDGLYAFVANFNLHGEHEPSSVSVVYTPDLSEVHQIETCTMPHGGRMHPAGLAHLEIDTRTFDVARRFSVAVGNESPIDPASRATMHPATPPTCSPTWAVAAPSGGAVYVACNKGDVILELDYEAWTLRRRMETGRGPYNLAITPNGELLVATLKQGGGVQFFDVGSGRSLAVVRSTTTVSHGVVISPDSRYAFVSVEGVGAEPGKVDIYDLARLERVASVSVGQQAGGIAFWKMAPATP
jgi:DNA-binding beta-propeller fold protein YncE